MRKLLSPQACIHFLRNLLAMNQNTPIEQAAAPRIDVVMGWDDFRFALSELSQNSHRELLDQQWFKLDPLEIFMCVVLPF